MDKDTALRLALEALKEDRAWLETDAPTEVWEKNNEAITAIKAALEAKDEPVAWMYSPTGVLFDICPNDADEGEFLPLYTTSPQRTWVKLTEEEIKPCWYEACQTDLELTSQLVVYFARAIEAKLKEKNT